MKTIMVCNQSNCVRKIIQFDILLCSYDGICNPECVTHIIDGLKSELDKNLFGQHIAIDTLIPALRKHVGNRDQSKKPLVLSFHGAVGTGKSHVVDLIIKNLYKEGKNSEHVHIYRGHADFPIDSEVDKYSVSNISRQNLIRLDLILSKIEKLVICLRVLHKISKIQTN